MSATFTSMQTTAELTLADPAATDRLGALLAAQLGRGATLLLCGPLGAGKSALARALIRARLGEPDREVPSPSYTLINIHEGAAEEIWHVDLYRLAEAEEAAELGLEEALGRALVLVEWPERLDPPWPRDHLAVALDMAGAEARHARLSGAGADRERVTCALDAWR